MAAEHSTSPKDFSPFSTFLLFVAACLLITPFSGAYTMAETLFRFCVIRPPNPVDPRYPAIDLGQQSDFQIGLGKAVTSNPNDPRTALETASSTYVQSTQFAPVASTDTNNSKLDAASNAILGLINGKTAPTHASSVSALATALGVTDLSSLPPWVTALETRLKDSILALRFLGVEDSTGSLASFAQRLQTLESVKRISTDPNFPLDSTDLSKYSKRALLSPEYGELKSIYSTAVARAAAEAAQAAARAADQERLNALWAERLRLSGAKNEIVKLPPIHWTVHPATPFKPDPPAVDLTHTTLANQRFQFVNQLSDLTLQSFKKDLGIANPIVIHPTPIPINPITPAPNPNPPPHVNVAVADTTPTSPANNLSAIALPLVNMSQALFSGLNNIQPQPQPTPALNVPTTKRYALLPSALTQLSATTTGLFKDLALDITSKAVDGTVQTLNHNLNRNAADINAIYSQYSSPIARIQSIGITNVQFLHPVGNIWSLVFKNGLPNPPSIIPITTNLPKPRVGTMTILGIADLLVVKQQLIGYEGGDVAYIENVLKGQTKTRELDTFTSTTVQQTNETDTTTEKSNETTTTDRFEVSHESQNAQKEDESKKAGATVSASYGPSVSVSVNASIAADSSTSNSTQEASKYSKDITTKATDKITQKIMTQTVTTTTSSTTTKETYAQTNSGTTQISGVYQWLNKVYEAQTWNYGMRTMLDFLIPEPGAFFLDKQTNPDGDTSTITIVPPFTKGPDQLDIDNYAQAGAQYGVTDLDPPPQEMSRATATYSAGKDEPMSKADSITIPQGFEVKGISVTTTGVMQLDKNQNWVIVTCGEFQWGWDPTKEVIGYVTTTTDYGLWSNSSTSTITGQGSLAGVGNASASQITKEQSSIPWSVTAAYMDSFTMTIELFLQRTDEAYRIWQNKTWSKIQSAAQTMIQDQQDAIEKAKYQAQFNSAYQGRNPDENAIIMRNEIKKNCISIMTDSHFDDMGAIQLSRTKAEPGDLPISELNLDKTAAHGPFVRFFEQAFEWEEMTWMLYPYFWGRKDHWYRRVDYADDDPEFEKFVQAGFARANVPVRSGFEGALEHYLSTGKIWDGGSLPGISSPTFLPIATEIQESLGKNIDNAVPYGDPWKVTVPTNLIRLRHDDQAPVWKKDPVTGLWTEQPDLGP